ncbi:GATA transcription factor 9-like isoform X1 [Zingiber officinale]|uniref:GATA transcription factor 9-like isoform X1 n=1 Tax=Zingiber officinale TaxID=94328 RepID=UPI001C4CFBCE|nr:GATA transcription factor 9-like isoform X1 [Zingiber officinale]XP_042430142.1 GATA transcription factor 9-like isoform X1 [Zingiber officinale]
MFVRKPFEFCFKNRHFSNELVSLQFIKEEEEEWLSIYVEDCFSSATSYNNFNLLPTSPPSQTPNPSSKPLLPLAATASTKSRTRKRRRISPADHTNLSLSMTSDPPLLHQAHWLADSELLILPKQKEQQPEEEEEQEEEEEVKAAPREALKGGGGEGQARRCSHCLSQKTPQWRAGPLGPKTLCNACGVRFKSGRLLPEYRPAKSPTFVSCKHSNSHKKVMMMRMALMMPSNSNST